LITPERALVLESAPIWGRFFHLSFGGFDGLWQDFGGIPLDSAA
jgi:hypothetical protein